MRMARWFVPALALVAFVGDASRGSEPLQTVFMAFLAAILAILLAHEMGHWLLARAWGVDSSLAERQLTGIDCARITRSADRCASRK